MPSGHHLSCCFLCHTQPGRSFERQVAQNVRTAVVDYKFLQQEFEQYHPSPEGQKVKTDALAALRGGDVTKAWELYDGLRGPAPPSKPRIINQP